MKKSGIIAIILLVILLGGWLIFRGDGSGVSVANVAESMLGKWQSVEDANFIREFKENDVVTDWYGGSEVLSGSWEVFTRSGAPQVSHLTFDDESTYMRMSLTGEEADMLYFQVVEVESERLELAYLGRGGILEFTKVTE